ncbi:hypothetical protein GEMRC1_010946 [Eukaryota sp. GEM-RC1]
MSSSDILDSLDGALSSLQLKLATELNDIETLVSLPREWSGTFQELSSSFSKLQLRFQSIYLTHHLRDLSRVCYSSALELDRYIQTLSEQTCSSALIASNEAINSSSTSVLYEKMTYLKETLSNVKSLSDQCKSFKKRLLRKSRRRFLEKFPRMIWWLRSLVGFRTFTQR